MQDKLRVIISGGGTGGHVFPAIAIADAIRAIVPESVFLFVGAAGRMEMERVPAAGYEIVGLWISGFQRSLTWRNLLFPVKLLHSWWAARRIVRRFRPSLVIGVGGYASGPVLRAGIAAGVPSVLQEQNSFPGVTNRILARKADLVCVAYEGMERYFAARKIRLTGNPIRAALLSDLASKRSEAFRHFELDPSRRTVFLFGGSLGARSMNEAMANGEALLAQHPDVQVIWQCGKSGYDRFAATGTARLGNIRLHAFIDRMDLAYAAADVVVARAGALSISELCLVGKPAVLVPSPYVAEDHQTKNAQALVDKGAALLVPDAAAAASLLPTVLSLLPDIRKQADLGERIRMMSRPDAAREIAAAAIELARTKGKR
ncbi:MAG: hypothetical protein RLY31_2769 [Bacteroidota bacterium]|jgi:UDP-N-acetylglucosamine--N-acetylmuramyl-(pentapeptide) pyrophosphoryl-undecaprenol N-acetylglucosamine transferase